LAFRRQKALSREQSLTSVPVRNEAIEAERTDAGEARLFIPRRETRWVRLLSRLVHVPKRQPVTLDEVGTFVWDLCDGEHTVRDITRELAARYKLHRKEAEVSVVAYLRQLAKRRIVGIAVLPQEKARAALERRD
jgi:hypothetical protein